MRQELSESAQEWRIALWKSSQQQYLTSPFFLHTRADMIGALLNSWLMALCRPVCFYSLLSIAPGLTCWSHNPLRRCGGRETLTPLTRSSGPTLDCVAGFSEPTQVTGPPVDTIPPSEDLFCVCLFLVLLLNSEVRLELGDILCPLTFSFKHFVSHLFV